MSKLSDAMRELKEPQLLTLLDEALDQGADPLDLLAQLNQGMTQVGELFSGGTYF